MFGRIKQCAIMLLALLLISCTQDVGMVANYTEEVSIYGDPVVQTGVIHNQAVDILFVVDESGSMSDDWETLANTMPDIYDILVGPDFTELDWRVGIRSTDPGGDVYDWVDYDDPNAYLKLMALTALLENHGREQGLDSAIDTVVWDETGFLREDADLLIVFISDEPDQSSISPSEYDNLMSYVKAPPFEVTESSIIATYEHDRCDFAQLGTGYIDVSETLIDLCGSNWDAVLDRPIEHLPTLNEVWLLEHEPLDLTRLKVFVSEDGIDAQEYDHWEYDEDRNAVVLTTIPELGSFVTIVYTI